MKYKGTLELLGVFFILQIIQTIWPGFIQYQVANYHYLSKISLFPLFIGGFALHMFSHAGWFHLLGNCSIGIPAMAYCEHQLGRKGMHSLFAVTGMLSCLFYALLPLAGEGVIGSSGAIFGLVASSCVLFCKEKASMLLGAIVLCLYLIPELFWLQMGNLDGVAHGAHVGGAIVGILYIAYRERIQVHKELSKSSSKSKP